MPITKFVAAGNTYTFPTAHGDQEYRDNFKEVQTRTSRIPGADGGVDEYGSGRAPGPVGDIQFGIVLEAATREAMQPIRDDLVKMREWGVGQLYFQPTDTLLAPRWAIARLKKAPIPEKRHQHTDLFQPVTLNFEAAEPFWYTAGNQELWDGTEQWDSDINWDAGSFTTITGSGTFTVTPGGNALTLGRFVAKVTGAQTFYQLTVRRLVNGGVVDEMVLQTQLAQNDVLEFDPRKQWVIVNGYDRIANFEFRHPDWLRLLPGANTIQVTLDDSTAQVAVLVYYFERYI